MILTRLIGPALDRLSPPARREIALWIVLISTLGVLASVPLITVADLALWLTLQLSWLALWLTGIDIYATTDVRVRQDDA